MDYKTPGVYIEEIPKFPPSVAQVETAIPAFIGYTENTTYDGESLIDQPRRIKSLADFEAIYGLPPKEAFTVIVAASESNTVIDSVTVNEPASYGDYKMYHALRLYFDNGGGPCYIVSTGPYETGGVLTVINGDDMIGALAAVRKQDEPTILVFPDAHDVAAGASAETIYQQALLQCFELQDRVVLMDVLDTGVIGTDEGIFRGYSLNSEQVKYGASYYPDLVTIYEHNYDEGVVTVDINGDGPVTLTSISGTFNNIYTAVKKEIAKKKVIIPPSGGIAGVYALVDSTRGVWKAPANVGLNSVKKPNVVIDDSDQESLNVDTTAGKSINAIRTFRGRGVMVWGARTLAGNDNEWRYISVRRFFNMVEESVKKASGQFVFEPNDANTWALVKSMISNFLTIQWRQGALAGATPDAAFYVKVGLGETMTALDILEGRMIIEIGMAAVRPAEFIILRFSHKMQES